MFNLKYTKLLVKSMAIVMIVALWFSFGQTIFAQGIDTPGQNTNAIDTPGEDDPKTTTLSNPLKVKSIGQAVNAGIDIFTYIAVLVGVLMLVWTGFQFVLAQGNAKKIDELKSHLLWIVVGIGLIIGARVIVQVVLATLESTGAVRSEVINSANDALKGK